MTSPDPAKAPTLEKAKMAKRLKLKLSRVIPSFQSCRSKDPSSLPSNPVPLFCKVPPVNPNSLHLPPPPPPPKPHHSSFKRHVSSAFTSMGCGFGLRSSSRCVLSDTDHTRSPPTPKFHWEKHDKWHVVAKIYDDASPRKKIYNSSASENDEVLFPPLALPPPLTNTGRRKRRPRKKKTTPRNRVSTSSPESGLFSSEYCDDDENDDVRNEEETETLVSSSRSFSTDTSSRESPLRARIKKAKSSSKNRCIKGGRRKSVEVTSPARLSRFQWLIPCTVEGKVRESFAVVKKSEDPYEDFKRSMMEMVLEKQMFEEKDLEQLLHCFLSLNSKHHHGVIVEAFSDIWSSLFSRRSIARRSSVSSTR